MEPLEDDMQWFLRLHKQPHNSTSRPASNVPLSYHSPNSGTLDVASLPQLQSVSSSKSVNISAPLLLFASSQFLRRTSLVRQLEERKIFLLERMHLMKASQFDVAVIVDERTCIVFVSTQLLSQQGGVESLVDFLITNVSLAFERCWLVAEQEADPGTLYPLMPTVQAGLVRLTAMILSLHELGLDTWLVFACTLSQLVEVVSQIAMLSCETSVQSGIWSQTAWIDRRWLEPDESAHERFLCACKMLNPFSAQVILANCPLRELFLLDFIELRTRLHSLPPRILDSFYQFITAKMTPL